MIPVPQSPSTTHRCASTFSTSLLGRSDLSLFSQARQETAVGNYVLPITTQIPTESVSAYATASAQRYFAQITPGTDVNQTAVQLLSQAPQTISPAVSWTMVNLRPYT